MNYQIILHAYSWNLEYPEMYTVYLKLICKYIQTVFLSFSL